jgi:prophage endopeptidase
VSALERFAAALLLVIGITILAVLGAKYYGARQFAAGHAAAVDERARADAAAVLERAAENTVVAAHQDANNATITEKTHEEVQPVRERIVTQRVYVGTAICGGGPAAPAEAESPGSSDGADPPGRLVREDVERDIRALKLAVEEDLATGRACQRVLEQEGMVP